MKYVVYILFSERDGGVIIDHTVDLALTMAEHEAGVKKSTRYRLPVKLIHKETVRSFKQVKMRERYWQSGEGEKEIESWVGKLPHPYEKNKIKKR